MTWLGLGLGLAWTRARRASGAESPQQSRNAWIAAACIGWGLVLGLGLGLG